jgi:hypothetical protein
VLEHDPEAVEVVLEIRTDDSLASPHHDPAPEDAVAVSRAPGSVLAHPA